MLLSHQDQTDAATTFQDILYADDLQQGIQGCNHFASVVGSVRACTGMKDAASSEFGLAKAKTN